MNYPSLIAVLQYMEANKRIELTRRCPTLQIVDKVTPLYIDYLFLSGPAIMLNEHTYNLGVLRHYPKGSSILFKNHEEENKNGGFKFDIDEFGHFEKSWFKAHFPGDIELESVHGSRLGDLTPEEEQDQIQRVEDRLRYLKSLKTSEEIQASIVRNESYLYAWNLKLQNIPAPFTRYLQYTYRNGEETEGIEYLEYDNKRLRDVSKYLCNFLFAGRRHPLRVNDLRIMDYGGALRLPESLKVSTKNIYIGSNVGSILKSVDHLLVHQNYEKVIVYSGKSLALNYNHPAILAANKFAICKIPVTGDQLHIVLNDRHKFLCVMNPEMTKEEYSQLIQKMKEDRREIGTECAFGIDSETIVEGLFADIKLLAGVTSKEEKDQGCSRFPYTYNVPIDDLSKLSIYCDRYTESEGYTPWCLRFSVQKYIKNDFDE